MAQFHHLPIRGNGSGVCACLMYLAKRSKNKYMSVKYVFFLIRDDDDNNDDNDNAYNDEEE